MGPVTRALRRWQRGAESLPWICGGPQLALVRRKAPAAALLQADMSRPHLLPASLDAVGGIYSLTPVPREQLGMVLGRVAEWLRPGGIFVATMGAGDSPA